MNVRDALALPDGWTTIRLRHLARAPIKNGVGEAANNDDPDDPRYIRITDIAGPRSLKPDSFRSLPPDVASDAPVANGDILLAAVGATYGKSVFVQELEGPACYAGYLVKFSAGDAIDGSFAAYWTESQHYWDQVRSEVIQSTIQNFSAAKYRDLSAPVPPLEVQKRIAAFLDEKTARIDALIEKKRALLERLAEKRQAIITQAVTKGLNPAAPMKDSGIDWLGQIPAHWEVKRLKFLGDTILGLTYSPFDVVNEGEGLLVLRSSNVQNGKLVWGDNVFVQSGVPEELIVRPGDILICSRNGSRALIGKNAVITDEYAGQTFGAFMTVFRTPMHRFIHLVLNSELFSFQSGRFMTSTINQLTVNAIKDFAVPVPPDEEQRAIADAVHIQLERLDLVAANGHLEELGS